MPSWSTCSRKFLWQRGNFNGNTKEKSRQKQFKFYYTPFSQSARTGRVSKCVEDIIYAAQCRADNVFFVQDPSFFLLSSFFGLRTKLSCVKYGCILCRANRAVYLWGRSSFLVFFRQSFNSH